MARKRKKRTAFGSEAARAAHEARVEEHLRMAEELIERSFAASGETRPASSLEYLEQVMARHAPRTHDA